MEEKLNLWDQTRNFNINIQNGIDLSIPLRADTSNPLAWYLDKPQFEAVRTENFVGLVSEGSSVNFINLAFNPHAHGTHTECLGHITEQVYSVNDSLNKYFFTATLITVEPASVWNEKYAEQDLVITYDILADALKDIDPNCCEALVIRTLPNQDDKLSKKYSNSNPCYIDIACIDLLNELNVQHLLIDQPSVDREVDGGELLFHHAFWQVPQNPQLHKTITEFIYVKDSVKDGRYILNLQTAPFVNDATPSRPVLFEIITY